MKVLEYKFEEIKTDEESKYIFQITNGRKLSKIYHSHDFFEIALVIDGECIQVVNGKEFQMESGDFIFIRPNDRHAFKSQKEDTSLLALSVEYNEFLNFAKAFGKSFSEALYAADMPEVFGYGENISEIYNICSSCLFSEKREMNYKFLLCMLINRFSDVLCEESEFPGDLARTLLQIKYPENMRDGISAMVRLSNYSHTQLSRLMKKHLNVTCREYLQNVRLTAAYNRIVFTAAGLEDIAEDVGYSSFSHFNVIFKKKFGITPAALRKKKCIRTV